MNRGNTLERFSLHPQLTNNMPQREDIIVARGGRLERGRFQPASSIMTKEYTFAPGPTNNKRPRNVLAGLRAIHGQETLRTRVAEADHVPSIVQHRIVVPPLLSVG